MCPWLFKLRQLRRNLSTVDWLGRCAAMLAEPTKSNSSVPETYEWWGSLNLYRWGINGARIKFHTSPS